MQTFFPDPVFGWVFYLSLLGLLGEYPATYNAIVGHLRGVVPAITLAPIDAAVRAALKSKGS